MQLQPLPLLGFSVSWLDTFGWAKSKCYLKLSISPPSNLDKFILLLNSITLVNTMNKVKANVMIFPWYNLVSGGTSGIVTGLELFRKVPPPLFVLYLLAYLWCKNSP
jgi:hypothetical protein